MVILQIKEEIDINFMHLIYGQELLTKTKIGNFHVRFILFQVFGNDIYIFVHGIILKKDKKY